MSDIKICLLDCDSTLSAIEGIDELGRLRGAETFAAVEKMTRDAMDGGVPMETIFSRRLELIRPTLAELQLIGTKYLEHVEPSAKQTIADLKAAGWKVIIVSGGFTQAIEPFAKELGVERVEAVVLQFDADGKYLGFEPESPTARTRGKNIVAKKLREEYRANKSVMIGDGASDLEVQGDVDYVVGFGGYAVREKVKSGADAYIWSLAELPEILVKLFGQL